MADPIGAAQASLVAYTKLVADTLWEVQQQRGYSASRSSAMGASLVAAGEELERLVAAVPDYAAIVGPREALPAALRANEASQAQLAAELREAIAEGERRLAAARARIESAAAALGGTAPTITEPAQ